MAKLSDTALTALAAAAGRLDHRVLPLPTTLEGLPIAVTKTLNKLIKDGLVKEITASAEDVVWKTTEAFGKTTLIITPAGLAAIGIEPEPTEAPTKPHTRPRRGKVRRKAPVAAKATLGRTSGRRGGKRQSKQDAVIALLRRKDGATIEEMMAATDWQAHSVRGFMSGALKKRLGLEVISEKNATTGERRYSVAPLPAGRRRE